MIDSDMVSSMIFWGPPGVGKTEFARCLAERMSLDRDAFFHLNMSEYGLEHSRARFLGAEPGYVGFKSTKTLFDMVRERPSCVILLDEVDRAHPSIQDILLSILEGQGRNSEGEVIRFSQAIFLMTSNLGDKVICDKFDDILSANTKRSDKKKLPWQKMREEVANQLMSGTGMRNILLSGQEDGRRLNEPFLDRMDQVIPFLPIKEYDLLRELLDQKLKKRGADLSEEVKHSIALEAQEKSQSTRALIRLMESAIRDSMRAKWNE